MTHLVGEQVVGGWKGGWEKENTSYASRQKNNLKRVVQKKSPDAHKKIILQWKELGGRTCANPWPAFGGRRENIGNRLHI